MADDLVNSFKHGPDEQGRFGIYGGRFVSETLMPLILDLEAEYERAKTDADFWAEMDDLWTHYVGRPSPLYHAERLSDHLGLSAHLLHCTAPDFARNRLRSRRTQYLCCLSSLRHPHMWMLHSPSQCTGR